MEPNKKPFPFTEKKYSSDEQFSKPRRESTYGKQHYEPRGYFNDEETIDPNLINQVIKQAPDYIKSFIDTIQDRNEMLRNVQLQRLLLHGPSGTGKTLLAKAIALQSVRKYYFIQTPDLLDSWKNCHQNLKKEIDFLAKYKEPIAIIFDEMDQITDQYKNKNSSDSAMPTAFWSMLDRCKRSFPHFLIIGTTNNRRNDFPPQVTSRFGKSNIISIPNPAFEIRQQVICYCLKERTHNLSENDIVDFAQRIDGRSCREIESIINDSVILAPKNNKIITLREIDLAETANPYEPSEDEIMARELGVSVERAEELISMEHVLEKRQIIIDYQQKKNSYSQTIAHHTASLAQAADYQRINNAQAVESHNHAVASQITNNTQAVASFNQTANHHNVNNTQTIASFNQANNHHADTNWRQDVDTGIDAITLAAPTIAAGYMAGGLTGATAGIIPALPGVAKIILRNI